MKKEKNEGRVSRSGSKFEPSGKNETKRKAEKDAKKSKLVLNKTELSQNKSNKAKR